MLQHTKKTQNDSKFLRNEISVRGTGTVGRVQEMKQLKKGRELETKETKETKGIEEEGISESYFQNGGH